ncbi:hypothetical protein F511_47032 [Dorcoceras hygrometricum]|uniref:Uncharacterized protein n=1 Tax=Dorcoceras hygrometricum TaxID=472368 RepID=A0A2Z6ZYR0_9LAMI|nr:hypothetical protein F511_47032 [Dorcoceras hygrometricum]
MGCPDRTLAARLRRDRMRACRAYRAALLEAMHAAGRGLAAGAPRRLAHDRCWSAQPVAHKGQRWLAAGRRLNARWSRNRRTLAAHRGRTRCAGGAMMLRHDRRRACGCRAQFSSWWRRRRPAAAPASFRRCRDGWSEFF